MGREGEKKRERKKEDMLTNLQERTHFHYVYFSVNEYSICNFFLTKNVLICPIDTN